MAYVNDGNMTLWRLPVVVTVKLLFETAMVSHLFTLCGPFKPIKTKNLYAMTLVKFQQKPFEKTFTSLFEDLFNHVPASLGREDWSWPQTPSRVPVNISESEKAWQLELVAPGFGKSDFQIKLENNQLTISAEKKDEQKQDQEKLIRREFSYRSVSRSFTVDDRIDANAITAKYEHGVLLVTLPKKEEAKPNPFQITVQ
jgi:HSP20 family protein